MALIKHSQRTIRKGCDSCGRTDLYWAHDTESPVGYGKRGDCQHNDREKDCNLNGRFTLIETDGTRHNCKASPGPAPVPVPDYVPEDNDSPGDTAQQEAASAGSPIPAPSGPAAAPQRDEMTVLREMLQRIIGAPQIDRAEVERIAREVIDGVVYPTRTVVIKDTVKREIEGNTHCQLADVVTTFAAGEHVMMVGPAGTGKSTLAEQSAEALGRPYYSLSLSPQTPASAIVGYMQAEGEYVRTLFREAYEHGGIFHFDEIDNAHPSVLAVINAALANGHMAFPDGMVKRHATFAAAGSANTYGRGATRAYVGRSAIDGATLDRFTVITVDIDEALETALANATGADSATVTKVLAYVRKLRKSAETNGLNVIISPRASVGMCRLLAAGMSWESAVDMRVRRGLDDSTWRKLSA